MYNTIRQPSLFDAILPILILCFLLALAVLYFGDSSSYGPNQISLLISAGVAALIGIKNGVDWGDIESAIIKGISLALGAILILLAVGSLIGTWLLAGTVPSMIYYGIKLLNSDIFYAACCLICAITALSIGSSWTVAATIGVALIGVATGLGLSEAITAGAVISGAYFGDKMSPLSDTTNLAPAVAGTDLFTHIRYMAWTAVPSFIITLVLFSIIGLNGDVSQNVGRMDLLVNGLSNNFHIDWYMLAPLGVTFFLAIKKVPAFPAISLGALFGGVWAVLFQQDAIMALANTETDQLTANITVVWTAIFDGIKVDTGDVAINELLSGGGMSSMLNTVWLIMSAMTFGAVMEKLGLLEKLMQYLLKAVRGSGSLISTTIVTAFGTNVLTADQYISIVMPGRMFKEEYQRRGLAPENLSRALEDGGTITSPLIPWNTCGAYMHSVLLVNPLDYAMYCFFNWLSPIISITLAMVGYKVRYLITSPKSTQATKQVKDGIASCPQ